MADFDMLAHVKLCLGITDDYHDEILKAYIQDVQMFLQDAGIPEAITQQAQSGGVVARGVADLWNYGTGTAALSPFFHSRATQLALKYGGKTNEPT